jgi:hypothetical protein
MADSYTYEPSTPRGKVRLLIGDTDVETPDVQLFTDEEIDAFLSMEDQEAAPAAALALEAIAANQVMVLKVIRTQDLSTDGAAVARELRQQARQLREDADAGSFDWAELVVDPATYAERLYNEVLRGG